MPLALPPERTHLPKGERGPLLRDLFGLAVWAGGCFGSTVYWRGLKLRLRKDGKIESGAKGASGA